MKRHFVKDIIVALLPLSLFLGIAYLRRHLFYMTNLRFKAGQFAELSFNRFVIQPLFNLFAPVIVGVILCGVLYYAWKNRASTVFISLFCGAFITNVFFSLCSLNVIRFIGIIPLGNTLLVDNMGGVELAGVMDGAYIVMFWVSLVCFIRVGRKNGTN